MNLASRGESGQLCSDALRGPETCHPSWGRGSGWRPGRDRHRCRPDGVGRRSARPAHTVERRRGLRQPVGHGRALRGGARDERPGRGRRVARRPFDLRGQLRRLRPGGRQPRGRGGLPAHHEGRAHRPAGRTVGVRRRSRHRLRGGTGGRRRVRAGRQPGRTQRLRLRARLRVGRGIRPHGDRKALAAAVRRGVRRRRGNGRLRPRTGARAARRPRRERRRPERLRQLVRKRSRRGVLPILERAARSADGQRRVRRPRRRDLERPTAAPPGAG